MNELDKILTTGEGYNIVYAKKGGIPKSKHFDEKREVIVFLVNELCNIDFLSINDRQLNIDYFLSMNKKFLRYLKLEKIEKL
jgi:hypothetical protein